MARKKKITGLVEPTTQLPADSEDGSIRPTKRTRKAKSEVKTPETVQLHDTFKDNFREMLPKETSTESTALRVIVEGCVLVALVISMYHVFFGH